MRRFWSILSVVCGALLSALASDADYSTRLWQMEDGLPHNIVQAIAQTQDGYLWVGTREGLARFDGNRFQVQNLPLAPQLPSILCLHEGRDGNLWIGTENLGLFRRHNGAITRCHTSGGTNEFHVYEIHEAGDGTIWVASSVGVFKCAGDELQWVAPFRGSVQALCVDATGGVWLAGPDLRRLDFPGVTNWVPSIGKLPHEPRRAYCDAQGTFWLGASNGLTRIQNDAVSSFRKSDGPSGMVSVIFSDHAGELWIGTYSGVSRFVEGRFITEGAPDEPSYRVYAIFEDRENNLWVGSEEGLTRLNPKRFRTLTKKDGLALNTVVTVCASRDGGVWISAWGGGLHHWRDGKMSTLNRTNGLSSDYIMAMVEGRNGVLWAGTDYRSTLNRLENGNITFLGPDQGYVAAATTALFEDERGWIWAGDRSALQCWDGSRFKRYTTQDGLSNSKVNALAGGADGAIWIGTDGGLTRWRDNKFENLALQQPLLSGLILSLYEDASQTLWIGTKGGGLIRWHEGNAFALTSAQGLFSDAIYSILEDNHTNLWLNSSRGIFRLEKKQIEAVARGQQSILTSISYGKTDGVLSSGQYRDVTQPSACKAADGRLWFRTTQGVAVVNPEEITTNERPPPVVIQEIIVDKQPQAIGNSAAKKQALSVPPGRGELEIQYAALSFRAPEKNRFRYKLDGVDLNWVDVGSRRLAIYNNLRPGHYIFSVIACNNDGVWNNDPAQLAFVLLPHFWQTWWFKLAIVLALALAAYGVYRFRAHRFRQIERLRMRIAADLHDDIGSNVASIALLSQLGQKSSTEETERRELTEINRIAQQTAHSIREIVWFINPDYDTLPDMIARMRDVAATMLGGIEHTFETPLELNPIRLSLEFRRDIFLIFKEALHNVVKHSGATRVEIRAEEIRGEFHLRIKDNGKGFDLRKPGKGNGLRNLRLRLEHLKGELDLQSEPGRGTTITVSARITQLHEGRELHLP